MTPTVVFPASIGDAVEQLVALDGARPLAGGTWVMRGALRGERPAPAYVSLSRVSELCGVRSGEGLHVGACVTHADLAASLADAPAFRGLRDAAAGSANPAIREIATVGGALATADFPASDLVTALLALDAQVDLIGPQGTATEPLDSYLASRAKRPAEELVTAVSVGRAPVRSAHTRLTLRKAGDYPVAIVGVSEDRAGRLIVAIGAVEAVPRRWTALEDALADGADPADAVGSLSHTLRARDGVEAPGWYRAHVLTPLVRRAVADLRGET